jgi:hypothetical protein
MSLTLAHVQEHWSADEVRAMMDHMPEPGESVVEFGPDDSDTPRRRLPSGEFLSRLGSDRRLVPLAAALGGLALFGSLISEWQLTEIDATAFAGTEVGTRPLVTSFADLGSWGGGYLAGLFLLTAAVVLALFGPGPGRQYARLTALGFSGLLLGVVAAIGSYLGDTSRILGQLNTVNLDDDQVAISTGRGVWCAAAGVALVLLAMILAGRHAPVVPEPADAGAGDVTEAPVWSWRRPATAGEDEPPDAPFDLTVEPAKPFTTFPENTDKPS